MFYLHSSNQTENLLEHLAMVIQSRPLMSPFAEEVFLIQSQGMERWLSQRLADKFQVWGNFQFLFPSKFFAALAEPLDARLSDEAFDRHLLLWRFESALRHLQDEPFRPLLHYLSGANSALKRFQLARQLSQIFDQYQMMRSDMLALWQRNELLYDTDSEKWQRDLWRLITADIGGEHRGALWLKAIDKFNRAESGEFAGTLPERISVFGVHSLPPLLLAYLQGLSRHCDVHFFLLNPVQVYWADLPSKKLSARLESFEGHPLLIALGQQGREFQQMILEQLQFEQQFDSFEPKRNGAANNLQRLQNDILNNEQPAEHLPADASIGIHACHSRMREVQVIKNQLLAALESDPELQLRDIVVMAPDIQLYAPFISAVFDDIQHAIADRSLRLSNTALDAFIRFLRLSGSRFGWQAVLDLLEQPAVYSSFDLSEAELDLIRFWIDDTRVRWGIDAAHKQQLGLPPLAENTWRSALERLLMGYAMADDGDFVHGVLPYPHIEGSSAQALGGLHDFLQLLFRAAEEFESDRTLRQWSETLFRYADILLSRADAVERQQLNELLLEPGERYAAVHNETLPLEVMISWLEGMVSERKSSAGFLRGQLTFCSMLPMRSIPFKIIALLGMNDGEFPKIDRQPTFDLIGRHFRLGDRSRRSDDRYQFLEILLSARRQLIISYIGQSIQHNEDIPPSVVVSELLDVLSEHYRLHDVVVKHPLQPFSIRYFDGRSPALFSYLASDCATAASLHGAKPKNENWWQGSIESDDQEVIDIADLFAFYRHPQRYFMQRRLGLRGTEPTAEAEEREPLFPDGLESYAVHHEWIAAELNGAELPLARLQAEGRWPSGTPGELFYAERKPFIEAFAAQIENKGLGERLPEQTVDIVCGRHRLLGKLGNSYRHGSLLYRYSTLKGKDFVAAWLHHLLVSRMAAQPTHLLCSDADLTFPSQLGDHEQLQALVDIFLQGQLRPDAFFTEAAFDYVRQAHKLNIGSRSKTDPLDCVLDGMRQRLEQPYEAELRLLFKSDGSLQQTFDQAFAAQCRTLLLPVWEKIHE